MSEIAKPVQNSERLSEEALSLNAEAIFLSLDEAELDNQWDKQIEQDIGYWFRWIGKILEIQSWQGLQGFLFRIAITLM
jgi:hypothetical protein